MTRDTHPLKQTRRPTLAAVSDPKTYKAKRMKTWIDVDDDTMHKEVEYPLFDAASGNTTTEYKGVIDGDNVLES